MLGDLLKRLLGDKNTKDRREYQPFIDKANQAYEKIKTASDDGLREQTNELKKYIQEQISSLEIELQGLKEKADSSELSIHEKEEIFDEIES